MKAMLVENETLIIREIEKPEPKSGEILIEVKAIGVNRADLLQRGGKYPSPKGWPEWPGLEVAGVVVKRKPRDSRVVEKRLTGEKKSSNVL